MRSGITNAMCGIEPHHKMTRSNLFFCISVFLLLTYTHIHPLLAQYSNISATVLLLITYASAAIALMLRKFRIKKRILNQILGFLVFVGGYIILTAVIYPEYGKVLYGPYHIFDNILFPMSAIWTFFFFLQDYDPKVFLKTLFWVAVTCEICAILESLEVIQNGFWLLKESKLSGHAYEVKHTYNIAWAYRLMTSAVIFAVFYFRSRKKCLLIPIAVAVVEMFLFGSRGSVFMFCICWAVCLLFLDRNRTVSKKGIILIMVLLVLMYIILMSPLMEGVAVYLKTQGITSRTLNMLLSGDAGSDSGRSLIYDKALEMIADIHIFGYGVYGDRYHILTIGQIATNGYGYCHNVFLELIITFGIFGAVLIIIGSKALISAFLSKANYDFKCLIIICFCCSLNLILSNSFWYQYYFWALAALLVRSSHINLKIKK